MKIVTLKCINCNAITDLNVESDKMMVFCAHCGTKNLIDDGTQKIIRHHKTEDITEIKKIEAKVKLKQMKINEKAEKKARKELVWTLSLLILLPPIGILLAWFLQKWSKETKKIVSVCFGVWTVVLIIIFIVFSYSIDIYVIVLILAFMSLLGYSINSTDEKDKK
jgi:preprotein translocase subunit SecF